MTRIKFFTVILLAVMGGFILSAPSESWAAEKKAAKYDDPNTSVLDVFKDFQKKNLVHKTGEKLSARTTAARDAYLKAKAAFDQKAKPTIDQCSLSYTQAIEMRWNKTKAAAKGAVDAAAAEEYWNAVANTLNAIANGVHTVWNCTGANLLGDKAKNKIKELGEKVIESLWTGGFANVSKVESIHSYCSSLGNPLSDAAYKELQTLAVAADEAQKAYKAVGGVDGEDREIWYYKYCISKDSKGNCKEYGSLEFVIDDENNTARVVKGASTGCEPLPFKLFQTRSCLFCPLFDVIFNAVQAASSSAYSTLGKPLSNLVLIGLSIWIALMVLSNVSAMTKQDAPKFLNDLFRASFKVFIIFLLLRNSSYVYGIIIGPLLKAGFEFGISFLNSGSSSLNGCTQAIKSITNSTSGVLPQYVYGNLMCFIKSIQYELATPQAIGSSLMCISTQVQARSNLGPLASVFPDFSMMLQGALIYIIAFILSLAFGFYLIDATVQLGIFGMVLPFLLLCWPFKVTNGYFNKGVGVFMNSWFIYVFMGIVVNISLTLIGQGLTGGKGGFEAVEVAINGDNIKALQELLGIGFAGFLVLVACCVFGVKLMMKVQDLAGTFSGGGLSLGIGNKIGGLAAAAGTGVAKNTAGLAGRVGSSALNTKIFEGKDGQYHSVADGLSALKSKAGRAVGRGMQGAGRAAGKAIGATGHAIGTVASTPVRMMRAAMRGLNRRQP